MNSEIFVRILFSRLMLKDIFEVLLCDWWSDFTILQGFHYGETLHLRSFAKIKPSQKFPNFPYTEAKISEFYVH